MTFTEWVDHWGEKRLEERLAEHAAFGKGEWENRHASQAAYPAWELAARPFWEEDTEGLRRLWIECGGRLFENGRMIAAKWDPIWETLSAAFYDGLGNPYPPYARSSCASWNSVGEDEAIVLGVITEGEWLAKAVRPGSGPSLSDAKRILMKEALRELEEDIHRNGGPPPGASRAERFAHERKRREEAIERSKTEYLERAARENLIWQEKNDVFRLMESAEESIKLEPSITDAARWQWLCEAAAKLTATPHFESYPNWRARSWILTANLHRTRGSMSDELAGLEYALTLNPKAPIKRRIAALKKNEPSQTP